MTAYVNVLERLVEAGGYTLPEGTDMWTIRTVYPDFRSSHAYRWPYPGQWAEAPGPINADNADPCPTAQGDGLCVATTWEGMASGGIPARTLLLCAINSGDALSSVEADKIRVRRAFVVDALDGARMVRDHGGRANLTRADLIGMDLARADLRNANLAYAVLPVADLTRANLARTNLARADLYGANLICANLTHANLVDANLTRANLYGANLICANLTHANLTRANLTRANLTGATYDHHTIWPAGFDPTTTTRAVKIS